MIVPLCDGRPRRRASPWVRALGSISLYGSAIATGCIREPEVCLSQLDEGDVVVTEIRGPQEGPDSRGEWFELYNASDDTVDLRGLRGVLTNLKGSIQRDFIVRESLLVDPGGYVVLGSLPLDETLRPELDYSFNEDFQSASGLAENDDLGLPDDADADPSELFTSARFELRSCERVVDRFVYADLPTTGTYSFDGVADLDAEANDDVTRWCTNDAEPPAEGPQTALGRPGSPGEANPPCP